MWETVRPTCWATSSNLGRVVFSGVVCADAKTEIKRAHEKSTRMMVGLRDYSPGTTSRGPLSSQVSSKGNGERAQRLLRESAGHTAPQLYHPELRRIAAQDDLPRKRTGAWATPVRTWKPIWRPT